MKEYIEERVLLIAAFIISSGCTVRQAAVRFGVSKSTVHKDMDERLQELDRGLYERVRKVLLHNKAERHLRGGEATKKRYVKRHEVQA